MLVVRGKEELKEQKTPVSTLIEGFIAKGHQLDREQALEESVKCYNFAVKVATQQQHPLLKIAQSLVTRSIQKIQHIHLDLKRYTDFIKINFPPNTIQYNSGMEKLSQCRKAFGLEFDARDLFERDGETHKVIEIIQEVIELHPSASLYILLGRCYDRQDDWNNAILNYENSLVIQEVPTAYLYKGIVLTKFDRLKEARATILKGMSFDFEHCSVDASDISFFLSAWKKCEQHYRESLTVKLEEYQLQPNKLSPREYLPHIIDATLHSDSILQESKVVESLTNPRLFYDRAMALEKLGLYQEAVEDLIVTVWATRIQPKNLNTPLMTVWLLKRRYLYVQLDNSSCASLESGKFIAYIKDMKLKQLKTIPWFQQQVKAKKVDLFKNLAEIVCDIVELINLEFVQEMQQRQNQLTDCNKIFLNYCAILGVLHATTDTGKYVYLDDQTIELVMSVTKQEIFLEKIREEKNESRLAEKIKEFSEMLSPILTKEGGIIPRKWKKKENGCRADILALNLLPPTAEPTIKSVIKLTVEPIVKPIVEPIIELEPTTEPASSKEASSFAEILENKEESFVFVQESQENLLPYEVAITIGSSDNPPPYSFPQPAESIEIEDDTSKTPSPQIVKPKIRYQKPQRGKKDKKKDKKSKKIQPEEEESELSTSEEDSFSDVEEKSPVDQVKPCVSNSVIESDILDEKVEEKQLSPCQKAFASMPEPVKKFEISPFLSWCMKALLDASEDPQAIVLCHGGYVRKLLSEAKYDTDGDCMGNVSEDVIRKVFGGMADIMKVTKDFGELYTVIFHRDAKIPDFISFNEGVEYQNGKKIENGLNEAKVQFKCSKILCDKTKPLVLRMSLAAESANFTMNAGLMDWMGYVYTFLPTTLTDIEHKIIRTPRLPKEQTACKNGKLQILQAVYYCEKTGFEMHSKFKKVVNNIIADDFKDFPAEDMNAFLKKVSKSGKLFPFCQFLFKQKLMTAFFPLVETILQDSDYKALFEQELKNMDTLPIYQRSHNYMYFLIVICTAPKMSVLQSCNGSEKPFRKELLSYVFEQIKQNKYFEANFRQCPAKLMDKLTRNIVMKLKAVLLARHITGRWRANMANPMQPPFFQQIVMQTSLGQENNDLLSPVVSGKRSSAF